MLSVFTLACHSLKTSVQKENIPLKQADISDVCLYNADSSFVACVTKENDKIANSLSNLFITKIDNDSVVYIEKIQFVDIKWISNEILEVKKGMNYLKDINTNVEIYYINVKTMEIKKTSEGLKLR